MKESDPAPAMNRKIFDLGLSVETVSLYLLCCALADAGTAITPDRILEKWNGTHEAFASGLICLEEKGILRKLATADGDQTVFRIAPADSWAA